LFSTLLENFRYMAKCDATFMIYTFKAGGHGGVAAFFVGESAQEFHKKWYGDRKAGGAA